MIESSLSHTPPRLSACARPLAVLLLAIPAICHSAALTGTVTDRTINRPVAGDNVVLIALTQSMEEVARTRTDAAGRYSLELPATGMHLIRVEHQKAAYFTPVPNGTAHADVDVYDAAPKLAGVTTEADMRRIEADQQGLHIVESYFVSNDSSPPRTQLTYEIYLPADAQLEASGAMGPEGMAIASSPVSGKDKGHYSFVFPVRPGRTRFQVSYHLPYSGSHTLQPRVSLPTANLAIALPRSMKFKAGNEASFQSINGEDPSTQIFVARNVDPSQSLAFDVSGYGALPQEAAQAQRNEAPADRSEAAPAPGTRPTVGLAATTVNSDPLHNYKWWILSGVALALVAAAGFILRSGRMLPPATQPTGIAPLAAAPEILTRSSLLDALKEELLVLETDRLDGKLSENQYRDQKAAFETVLSRALVRHPPPVAQIDSV